MGKGDDKIVTENVMRCDSMEAREVKRLGLRSLTGRSKFSFRLRAP
jgi:hypothetical protein